MRVISWTAALLWAGFAWAAHDGPHGDSERNHGHDHGPRAEIATEEGPNPWTHLEFKNNPEHFQFLIVTDRTGGHRPGVFEDAVRKINLLQPEFVVSVGDLIEGYTEELEQLETEWEEFNSFVERLEMPFFYVPGNHDISNPVMAELWKERLGRSYYHFVYGDVLFLCLNSEDPPFSQISEKQRAYIRETLDANADVRWTLVFVHKPLWTIEEDSGWDEVEAMLADRPHTVFAGHYHNYMKHVRNDGKANYFVLATTGGGSQLRGPAYGEFDHVVWVTMTDQGPRIANLMLEGIHDEDIRTSETAALLSPFSRGAAVAFEPIELPGPTVDQATATLRLTNPASIPMAFSARWETPQGVTASLETSKLELPGGQRRSLDAPIRAAGAPVAIEDLGPLLLRWKAVYHPEERAEPVEIEGTSRLVLERRRECPRIERAITVDGDLADWPEPPIRCTNPAQVLGSGAEDWNGPEDCQFRFGTAHDEKFIYVAVEVSDDQGVVKPKAAPWTQDSVVLYVDGRPDPDRSEGRGENDFAEYLMLAVSPGLATGEQRIYREEDLPEGVVVQSRRTATGHTAEFAIPVALFDEPQGGRWEAFRLNVIAVDYDEGESGAGLAWRPDWRGAANIFGSGTFRRP